NAGDRDGFAYAHVLVGEGGGAGSCGEHIAGHPVIGKGDGGGGITVVNLANARCAHGQGPLAYVGGGGSRGVGGGIFVGVGAADADAGDFNALVEADVFGVEGRRCVSDGQDVARHTTVAEGDGGRGGSVVDLIDAGGGNRQRVLGDVRGRRGRRVKSVVR